MPDSNGRFKGAAYPHIPWETEAERRRKQQEEGMSNKLAADRHLGYPGRLLSMSKRNPPGCEDHTIYWNACIFDKKGTQIWWGDIDVTAQATELQALADEIGKIYVTPEYPHRFKGLQRNYDDRVLEITDQDTTNEAVDAALEAYDQAVDAAREAYDQAVDAALETCDQAVDAAREAYDQAIAPAREAYNQVVAAQAKRAVA